MKPKFPEELRKAGPGIPPATFGEELATTPRHAGWAFEIQKTLSVFTWTFRMIEFQNLELQLTGSIKKADLLLILIQKNLIGYAN